MEIKEASDIIGSFARNGSYLGLERMRALMNELGNPQDRCKYVHIAGTNGKGSTAAMTESILRQAGYRTGLYTSPALLSFNERIRTDGEVIPDGEVIKRIPALKEAARKIQMQGHDAPSEFEAVTALAFMYFADCACDIVVLEVGMGGRLDATNIIRPPLVCAIASISLDHTAVLGDNVAQIAAEKAGIIKSGTVVCSYHDRGDAYDVISEKCLNCKARLLTADFDSIVLHGDNIGGQSFDGCGIKNIRLSLLGEHQRKNAALAILVCRQLADMGYKITDNDICRGLEKVRWDGRLQLLPYKSDVLLDGAHNPDGAERLDAALAELYVDKKIIFVVGALADKDTDGILRPTCHRAAVYITATPPNPRALSSSALAVKAIRLGAVAIDGGTPREAVSLALKESEKQKLPVCCYGSLYMSGDIQRYFSEEMRGGGII